MPIMTEDAAAPARDASDAQRGAEIAALAGRLGLSAVWTLRGQAGRWIGSGVELVLDDAERGGLAFVLTDDGGVAVFGRRDPLSDVASAALAARGVR